MDPSSSTRTYISFHCKEREQPIPENEEGVKHITFKTSDLLCHAEKYAKEHIFVPEERIDFLLYVRGITQTSEFKNDTNQYMIKWKEKRGSSQVFKIPEDDASKCINGFLAKIAKRTLSIGPKYDREDLLTKAESYVWRVKENSASSRIWEINEILAIIDKDDFDNDPEGYLRKWVRLRGTEDVCYHDDAAHEFLVKYFNGEFNSYSCVII